MQASYNSWLVALSIVVAMVVAYTALKLAARVAEAGRSGGGSGCSAAPQPWAWASGRCTSSACWRSRWRSRCATASVKTLLSLAIAIVTSGFALAIASRPQLSLQRLAIGSVVMGAGICAMHYSGMAAIQIVPMITLRAAARRGLDRDRGRRLVRGSVAGVQAAQRPIEIHRARARRRRRRSWDSRSAACTTRRWRPRSSAVGSYCLGGAALDNDWLALTIGIVSLGVLALTLITAVYDAHLVSQTRQDALRLEQVNAALQHGKNLLALATRAAGISSWELDIATQTTLWTENEIESLRAAGVDAQRAPDAIMAMTHPDDRSIMFDAVRKAVGGRQGCLRLPLSRRHAFGRRRSSCRRTRESSATSAASRCGFSACPGT